MNPLYLHFYLYYLFIFNWITASQCHVSFCCKTTWISYQYALLASLRGLPPLHSHPTQATELGSLAPRQLPVGDVLRTVTRCSQFAPPSCAFSHTHTHTLTHTHTHTTAACSWETQTNRWSLGWSFRHYEASYGTDLQMQDNFFKKAKFIPESIPPPAPPNTVTVRQTAFRGNINKIEQKWQNTLSNLEKEEMLIFQRLGVEKHYDGKKPLLNVVIDRKRPKVRTDEEAVPLLNRARLRWAQNHSAPRFMPPPLQAPSSCTSSSIPKYTPHTDTENHKWNLFYLK